MIDRDLAELYGVETRVLNQAVKRIMERFPERFRLTSSSCHPKFFVNEFSYFLMPYHQHGLGVNLLVQR